MPKNKVFQQNFEKLKTEKVFKISKSPINVPPSLYKYLTDQNEACINCICNGKNEQMLTGSRMAFIAVKHLPYK